MTTTKLLNSAIVSKARVFVAFGILALPQIVFAAPENFKALVNIFINIIAQVIPIVVLLAVLYFFWGLVKYIFAQGNEEQKVDGKNIMLWGLIGLFFIFAIYGVIRLFGSVLPKFPGGGYQAPTNQPLEPGQTRT